MVLLALCATLAGHGALASGCIDCHSDPRFAVQNHRIYDYFQDWLKSPHKRAGVGCEACHGGNPEVATVEEAHEGVLHTSDPTSSVFYQRQPDTCGECHPKVAARFKESKHYEVLEQNGHLAPTCSTCHRAMNRKPYYWQVAETTCTACHNATGSGSLPMVSKQADEILHRLNIIKGYLGWTRIYYASQGWPGDSRQLVEEMEAQYHAIRSRGHNFELAGVGDDSIELLTRLKTLFAETSAEQDTPERMR